MSNGFAYSPYLGNMSLYGEGPEHLFLRYPIQFLQAQPAAPATTPTPAPSYQPDAYSRFQPYDDGIGPDITSPPSTSPTTSHPTESPFGISFSNPFASPFSETYSPTPMEQAEADKGFATIVQNVADKAFGIFAGPLGGALGGIGAGKAAGGSTGSVVGKGLGGLLGGALGFALAGPLGALIGGHFGSKYGGETFGDLGPGPATTTGTPFSSLSPFGMQTAVEQGTIPGMNRPTFDTPEDDETSLSIPGIDVDAPSGEGPSGPGGSGDGNVGTPSATI